MNWEQLLSLPVAPEPVAPRERKLIVSIHDREVEIGESQLNQLARSAGYKGDDDLDVLDVLAEVSERDRLNKAGTWLSGLLYLAQNRPTDSDSLMSAFYNGDLEALVLSDLSIALNHPRKEIEEYDQVGRFFYTVFADYFDFE